MSLSGADRPAGRLIVLVSIWLLGGLIPILGDLNRPYSRESTNKCRSSRPDVKSASSNPRESQRTPTLGREAIHLKLTS